MTMYLNKNEIMRLLIALSCIYPIFVGIRALFNNIMSFVKADKLSFSYETHFDNLFDFSVTLSKLIPFLLIAIYIIWFYGKMSKRVLITFAYIFYMIYFLLVISQSAYYIIRGFNETSIYIYMLFYLALFVVFLFMLIDCATNYRIKMLSVVLGICLIVFALAYFLYSQVSWVNYYKESDFQISVLEFILNKSISLLFFCSSLFLPFILYSIGCEKNYIAEKTIFNPIGAGFKILWSKIRVIFPFVEE